MVDAKIQAHCPKRIQCRTRKDGPNQVAQTFLRLLILLIPNAFSNTVHCPRQNLASIANMHAGRETSTKYSSDAHAHLGKETLVAAT